MCYSYRIYDMNNSKALQSSFSGQKYTLKNINNSPKWWLHITNGRTNEGVLILLKSVLIKYILNFRDLISVKGKKLYNQHEHSQHYLLYFIFQLFDKMTSWTCTNDAKCLKWYNVYKTMHTMCKTIDTTKINTCI